MRRLALLAPALIAVVPAAMAASATPPRAQLAAFTCKHSIKGLDRSMSVQAVMRPVAGTARLALRFQLLQRTPQGRWVNVSGGDLKSWITPRDPTLGQNPRDVWMVTKIVRNLRAPQDYRFRVTFRWTDSHNHVLASQKLASQKCHQPDLRPDLVVKAPIAVTQVSKTQLRYSAVIRNTGRTAAVGPFQVALTFPPKAHIATQTVTINRLGRHKSKAISFVGARCTSTIVPTITADPSHVINERTRKNNAVQAKCPPLHSVKR